MARQPRGNAEGTLDTKGRAAVPTRFRPIFEGRDDLVLWEPQGLEQPYLVLTSDEYFDDVSDREYAGAAKPQRLYLTYETLGHMDDIELDSAWRFVIHEKYNEKAGFVRGEKLFFLANRTYMEIWPLHVWKKCEAGRMQERARSLIDHTPDPITLGIKQSADNVELRIENGE